MSTNSSGLKPIILYDHLPGILAGYPAVLFGLLAILSAVPYRNVDEKLVTQIEEVKTAYVQAAEEGDATATLLAADSEFELVNKRVSRINSHMLFWVGLSIMLVWYVAFRFNMPKSKFILMSALLGCFVGIPVILELTGFFQIFSWLGSMLGWLEPRVNTGAWVVMSLVFFIIWLGNYIYSLTHMKVRIDESGLTVNRLGGKGERFELIGLKTENEPLDYLELFLAGVGSLTLKTRMGKPIFTMKRVMGLYRTPWFPFFKGKLARIEEMLSYQGKVVSVDRDDKLDAAEMADGDSDGHDEDDVLDGQDGEMDGGGGSGSDEGGIS
jgi:hypothetical protein